MTIKKGFLLILLLIISMTLSWQKKEQDNVEDKFIEITPRAENAIKKGLDYLAANQNRDGSVGRGSAPVCATALAGLAWMAYGDTPSRGKYAENIKRGINFLLKCSSRQGLIQEIGGGGSSGMHGHGFAVLFLAEVLGQIEDLDLFDKTRRALKQGVKLIEHSQNKFGGWNSQPDPNQTDDGSGAVAIMQIQALRSARESGITIKSEVIKKTKKYLLEMTSEDGWYAYNYGMRGGSHHSSALTGAGMYMLGAMDLWDHKKYTKGIAHLMNAAPFLGKSSQGDGGWTSWYYYTAFYASLAIFQHGGKEWKKWYPKMRDELIKKQQSNGGWGDTSYGGVFDAFAVLTLELPYRLLPAFQAGGRGAEGK
jgi:hypothetical protein